MTRLEMVERAVRELGDATGEQLAEFVCGEFGVRLEPVMALVLRASLRERELREKFRAEARAIIDRAIAAG